MPIDHPQTTEQGRKFLHAGACGLGLGFLGAALGDGGSNIALPLGVAMMLVGFVLLQVWVWKYGGKL